MLLGDAPALGGQRRQCRGSRRGAGWLQPMDAAERLIQRGAKTSLWETAAFGLQDRVNNVPEPPSLQRR